MPGVEGFRGVSSSRSGAGHLILGVLTDALFNSRFSPGFA